MKAHAIQLSSYASPITPSKEEYLRYAQSSTLIPVYKEVIADTETPLSALFKLGESPYRYILESVEGGDRLGRYSFVGNTASCVFLSRGNQIEIGRVAPSGRPDRADGRLAFTTKVGDPLHALRELLSEFKPAPVPGLPRFYGGAVGYLGYDLVRMIHSLPEKKSDPLGLPDSYLIFSDVVLIFDHVQRTLKVVVNSRPGADPGAAYKHAVAEIERVLTRLREERGAAPFEVSPDPSLSVRFRANMDKEQFISAVKRCQAYIQAGEAEQVVLSQRFETPVSAPPDLLYRVLRTVNPSPYMYYLQLGDIAVVGSSPEVMVRVEEGVASIRPIAGTRPRGASAEEDRRLAAELAADAKEREEHMMLVDLGVRDLTEVCEPGTVEVSDLMSVERYSHVIHLVSNVSGRLKAGEDAFDLLRSTFPAGTVCGAPRKRALEIIEEVEPERRGPYAGAIGYFAYSGNMDSCITIRTAVIHRGRAYVQAGAGIVAASIPENEYMETLNKAKGVLKAIAIAERATPV